MPHAVFIRDIASSSSKNFHMLAYDIKEEVEAHKLIQSIATSFPEYGLETTTGVYWYRDRNGLHEIWAWPIADRDDLDTKHCAFG